MKSAKVILIFITFWHCRPQSVTKQVDYPKIPSKLLYEVAEAAIVKSSIKRHDLDLLPASIDPSKLARYEFPFGKGAQRFEVLSKNDIDFMMYQNGSNFVWDNHRMKFEQHDEFKSFYDISLPVFSLDFHFSIISIRQVNEAGMSPSVTYLFENKKTRWQIVDEVHEPYHVHMGEPQMKTSMRKCRCLLLAKTSANKDQ